MSVITSGKITAAGVNAPLPAPTTMRNEGWGVVKLHKLLDPYMNGISKAYNIFYNCISFGCEDETFDNKGNLIPPPPSPSAATARHHFAEPYEPERDDVIKIAYRMLHEDVSNKGYKIRTMPMDVLNTRHGHRPDEIDGFEYGNRIELGEREPYKMFEALAHEYAAKILGEHDHERMRRIERDVVEHYLNRASGRTSIQ